MSVINQLHYFNTRGPYGGHTGCMYSLIFYQINNLLSSILEDLCQTPSGFIVLLMSKLTKGKDNKGKTKTEKFLSITSLRQWLKYIYKWRCANIGIPTCKGSLMLLLKFKISQEFQTFQAVSIQNIENCWSKIH